MGRRAQAQSRRNSLVERFGGVDRVQLVSAQHENQCQDHPCQVLFIPFLPPLFSLLWVLFSFFYFEFLMDWLFCMGITFLSYHASVCLGESKLRYFYGVLLFEFSRLVVWSLVTRQINKGILMVRSGYSWFMDNFLFCFISFILGDSVVLIWLTFYVNWMIRYFLGWCLNWSDLFVVCIVSMESD